MLVLLLIAIALLGCLLLLTWAAVRSWTVFAWLTLPPNLLVMLAMGVWLSVTDRSPGETILQAAQQMWLLGYVEVLLFTLSVVAALMALLLRGVLR